MKELRKRILWIEKMTRNLQSEYDNKYAQAHLREINLQAQLMLIQLDYARLAQEATHQPRRLTDNDPEAAPRKARFDPYGGRQ